MQITMTQAEFEARSQMMAALNWFAAVESDPNPNEVQETSIQAALTDPDFRGSIITAHGLRWWRTSENEVMVDVPEALTLALMSGIQSGATNVSKNVTTIQTILKHGTGLSIAAKEWIKSFRNGTRRFTANIDAAGCRGRMMTLLRQTGEHPINFLGEQDGE